MIKFLKEENEKTIKFYKNAGYFSALMVKFTMKNFAGPKAKNPDAGKLLPDFWLFGPGIILLA